MVAGRIRAREVRLGARFSWGGGWHVDGCLRLLMMMGCAVGVLVVFLLHLMPVAFASPKTLRHPACSARASLRQDTSHVWPQTTNALSFKPPSQSWRELRLLLQTSAQDQISEALPLVEHSLGTEALTLDAILVVFLFPETVRWGARLQPGVLWDSQQRWAEGQSAGRPIPSSPSYARTGGSFGLGADKGPFETQT